MKVVAEDSVHVPDRLGQRERRHNVRHVDLVVGAQHSGAGRGVHAVGADEQSGVLSGAVAEADPYPVGLRPMAETVVPNRNSACSRAAS